MSTFIYHSTFHSPTLLFAYRASNSGRDSLKAARGTSCWRGWTTTESLSVKICVKTPPELI